MNSVYSSWRERFLEGTNKTLCAPRPRRKEQWPHRKLSQTCLWGPRSPLRRCGLTVTCHGVRGSEYNSPFEGGRKSKECSNCCTTAVIAHASKVMLKILQARFQQNVKCELPDVQAGFRKSRGIRDQIANISWIMEKAREFQKNIYFCFIDYTKAFDCVDHNKLWNTVKEIGIPDHLTCLLRQHMQHKEQQLELDMEQWTGSKSEKEYIHQVVYCHPAYLTYMQSTLCEMASWVKLKIESDCWEKYQPQIRRWHHSNGRKQRWTKASLDEDERGEWKSWLKIQHLKN